MQQCISCHKRGIPCQLLGTSWVHSTPQSTLGKRIKCECCATRRRKCEYEEKEKQIKCEDEWNYNVKCKYCTRNNKHCWPLVSFNGMRKTTSRLFSGVDNTFVVDNNLSDLVAHVTFEAAANFKETVDHPKNFGAIISTMRPARARNNYGRLERKKYCLNKLYEEIASYGSGCGSTSVGSTFK